MEESKVCPASFAITHRRASGPLGASSSTSHGVCTAPFLERSSSLPHSDTPPDSSTPSRRSCSRGVYKARGRTLVHRSRGSPAVNAARSPPDIAPLDNPQRSPSHKKARSTLAAASKHLDAGGREPRATHGAGKGGLKLHGNAADASSMSATPPATRSVNVSTGKRSPDTPADRTGRERRQEGTPGTARLHRSGKGGRSADLTSERRRSTLTAVTGSSPSSTGTDRVDSGCRRLCHDPSLSNSNAPDRSSSLRESSWYSSSERSATTPLSLTNTKGRRDDDANGRCSRCISETEPSAGFQGNKDLPSPLPSVDRVYPFTERVPVSVIATHMRERITWNRMVRQLIFAIPLVALASLYTVYCVDTKHTNVYQTEVIRQLLERSPFPSAAVELERFRQQKSLGMTTPQVRANRVFLQIRSQTDWLEFFTSVVLPSIFPQVVGLAKSSFQTRPGCREGCHADAALNDHTTRKHTSLRDTKGCSTSITFSGDKESRDVGIDGNTVRWTDTAKVPEAPLSATFVSTSSGSSNGALATDYPPSVYLYDSEVGVDAGEHVFLGALRTRTIRMRSHSAALQRRMYPPESVVFPRDGWSRQYDRSREDKTPSRCPSLSLRHPSNGSSTPVYVYREPEDAGAYCVATTGRFGTYHCGGYTFDIPFRATASLAAQYQAAIANQSCFFVDNWSTRYVVVEFFSYTPSTDSFHLVKYKTEVSAAGGYVNKAVYRSFPVWTAARTGQLALVCVTAAYTALYLCSVLARLYEQTRHNGGVILLFSDCSAWMDLGAVVSLSVSFAYYFLWLQLSVAVAPQLSVPMQTSVYPAFLDSIEHLYDRHTVSAAIAVLFCFNRLCTLRVVLRPLDFFLTAVERSSSTLVVLAAVYAAVVSAHALVGWAVFGPFTDFYSTFAESLFTCLTLWTSANLLVPSSENISSLFVFFLGGPLLFVFGVIIVSLSLAIVLHAFAQAQVEYGVAYDKDWLMFSLRRLSHGLTWPRLKRFCMMVVYPQRERHHLGQLARRMEVTYTTQSSSPAPISACEACRREWQKAASQDRSGRDEEHGELNTSSSRHDVEVQLTGGLLPGGRRCHLEATATSVDRESGVSQHSCTSATQLGREVPPSAPEQHISCRSCTEGTFGEELRRQSNESRTIAAVPPRSPPCIDFFEWVSIIPPDTLSKCGGIPFFADLWTDWMESQAGVSQTPAQETRRLFQEETAMVTERAVAGGIVAISQFDATLTQCETHVDMLLQSVSWC